MGTQQLVILCSYGYDPLDRLISQLQPDAPAHQRFYCKSRLATEIQGAIGFSVFQNNDLLLAQHKNQGGAVESTLLATDQQRSVLHTFTADQQQHPIAYSPYGHRQAESGLTSLLGFNGERPDPVTGHYLLGNGYRAFNPVLMRFNSPDSWSPFGKGGLNAYAYCMGDPINFHDPSGHIRVQPTPRPAGRRPLGPTFKSGPEKVFTQFTEESFVETLTTNNRKLNGEWTELTSMKVGAKNHEKIKFVSYDGKIIGKQEIKLGQDTSWAYTKHNASLQELSYAQVAPEQLKQLPRKLYNSIDIDIDKINMYNAASKMTPELMERHKMSLSSAGMISHRIVGFEAVAGEIRGVHPDKASQLIRERHY